MSRKPLLLDGFCGAGGAGYGYHLAGFEVVGVDNRPMKNYPFEFVQADFFEFVAERGREFDAIHASPPCQGYSRLRHFVEAVHGPREYPMLLDATRAALRATGALWVIENVEGAPLDGIKLCGTMFGLKVYRHRLFESNALLMQPPHPRHTVVVGRGRRVNDRREPNEEGWVSHAGRGTVRRMAAYSGVGGHCEAVSAGMEAMGLEHHMTRAEIAQAIPPAYTSFIGEQLLWHLEGVA